MTTLRLSALGPLCETDAVRKAERTLALDLTLPIGPDEVLTPTALIPGRPHKPALIAHTLLKPKPLSTLEGRALLVHSVAHIELNAIDLALDVVFGVRLRIACGLHHALISLAGRSAAEPPRLFLLGASRAGALGTGLIADAHLAPGEVDLSALLAATAAGEGGGALDRELPVACGPHSSAFALRGRVFIAGRLESPLLLGAAGSAAAAAAGKSADERALMRDLGLLGDDEAGAAALWSVVDALDAAGGDGVVARSFVPVLEQEGGGRGRVAALSLGAAHAATLEIA